MYKEKHTAYFLKIPSFNYRSKELVIFLYKNTKYAMLKTMVPWTTAECKNLHQK